MNHYGPALAKANEIAAGSVPLREALAAYVELHFGDQSETPENWQRLSRAVDRLEARDVRAYVSGCRVLRELRGEGTA